MKILPKIKKIQCRCNAFITRQLRKVSIFQRLNISFLVLLLGTAVFLTFFSFSKYSAEIIFQSGEICVYVCSEYSVKSTGYYAGV